MEIKKKYILHFGERQVRCCLIAVWRRGGSGQNVPITHLPIHGVGSEMLNYNMEVCISISSWIIILYLQRKVFGILQNMYKFINFETHSKLRPIHKYSSPVAGSVCVWGTKVNEKNGCEWTKTGISIIFGENIVSKILNDLYLRRRLTDANYIHHNIYVTFHWFWRRRILVEKSMKNFMGRDLSKYSLSNKVF